MTLSQAADFGELVGGIAVVASLVYLALQVRQSTRTTRGSTLHLNTEVWSALFLRLSDAAVAQAYVAGMAGRADIKPLHYTQFFLLCRAMFLGMEDQFYQAREGILDPEIYASYERATSAQLLAFPGFRLWWQQTRSVFTPAFVEHVDALIANTPPADPGELLRAWRRLAADAPGASERVEANGRDAQPAALHPHPR